LICSLIFSTSLDCKLNFVICAIGIESYSDKNSGDFFSKTKHLLLHPVQPSQLPTWWCLLTLRSCEQKSNLLRIATNKPKWICRGCNRWLLEKELR
jgi:hypothetical protein